MVHTRDRFFPSNEADGISRSLTLTLATLPEPAFLGPAILLGSEPDIRMVSAVAQCKCIGKREHSSRSTHARRYISASLKSPVLLGRGSIPMGFTACSRRIAYSAHFRSLTDMLLPHCVCRVNSR
ncbi:hypothetical protein AcW1_002494 [Taiwanofungus camphoratus]|nr:hypothetical protein AcV7_005445 [Antrodia cinnamomea]KAI0943291.1 hypothetical protein AcW1_002494 [Antrodia cinnamomea]